jgi:hypothetical protein
MTPATTLSTKQPNALLAFLYGGFICGCMDITAALVVYGSVYGVKPLRLLQGIAGGFLGPRTFEGGIITAVLGLFCHFLIAFSAAAVYVLVSRSVPALLEHPFVFGPLYGIAVYFFMNRVVVQLSNATKYPFSLELMLIGVVIHIICVGTPIALAARRFLLRRG